MRRLIVTVLAHEHVIIVARLFADETRGRKIFNHVDRILHLIFLWRLNSDLLAFLVVGVFKASQFNELVLAERANVVKFRPPNDALIAE